jgi:hypothetical protein
MNRRRLSNGLDRKQVNELHRGWEHAARLGRTVSTASRSMNCIAAGSMLPG